MLSYILLPSSTDETIVAKSPITSFEQGDVVVINLEKSVKDKYSPGIFGVN